LTARRFDDTIPENNRRQTSECATDPSFFRNPQPANQSGLRSVAEKRIALLFSPAQVGISGRSLPFGSGAIFCIKEVIL
jgi:hypothetical protein